MQMEGPTELKAYLLLMDMIPALARGNLRKMGDTMWEIEFRGSKRAEVQHHTFILYSHMNALRPAGLEFVAMSSVGPSICIVTVKTAADLQPTLQPLAPQIAAPAKQEQPGITITKT